VPIGDPATDCVIHNPATAPFAAYILESLNAAPSFGVEARVAHVSDVSELETVVATQAREPNSGLIVLNEDFMIAHRVEIISLAARLSSARRLPIPFLC
jgi:putative tryptophan/tyrosine transport system substrate-binding protein